MVVLDSADESDRVRLALGERGIQAHIHYVPLHSSTMGKAMGYRAEDLPVTEDLAGRLLRLPMHNNLGPDDVDAVVDAVTAALR